MSLTLRPSLSPSLVSLALLALASASLAQGAPLAQGATAADPVLEELGITAYTLQDIDLPERIGTPFQTTITLDGLPFTLELWPKSVRSADFTLMVQEADGILREHQPAASRTYRGTLLERPDARVAASLLDDGLTAQILFAPDVSFTIQPTSVAISGANPANHVVYAAADVLPVGDFCATDDSVQAPSGMTQQAGTGLKSCDIAFDTDVEFYQDNGSSVNNTVNDVENILNGIANIYENDCNITYEISFLVVRTSNPDPYTTNDPSSLLGQVGTEWSTNQLYTQRDIVHLMTGRNLSGSTIGIAYLGAICSGGAVGTGLSESTFTSNYNSRVGLTSHELGHNWNASHCSGGSCRIMCASLGGCSGTLTSFGNASINTIVGYAASRSCIIDLASPRSIPFTDTFDVSGLNWDNWIYKAYAVVNNAGTNPPTGTYSLNLDAQSAAEYADNEVRSNYILLANESDVTLTYHTQHSGVESGEELVVEYVRSNGDWTELNRITSNGTDQTSFTLHQDTLPNNAYHNNFRLRFRVECDESDDDWFVDDIVLETIPPCPNPVEYGTGKVNSMGTLPLIGYVGTNSYSANDLSLQLYNARPNQVCMPFWSVGPYNGSILGGTLLVAPPLNRTSIRMTDIFGMASFALPIDAGDVGTTRYYQWFFRDPGHADGTNAGLSNALEVPFCN